MVVDVVPVVGAGPVLVAPALDPAWAGGVTSLDPVEGVGAGAGVGVGVVPLPLPEPTFPSPALAPVLGAGGELSLPAVGAGAPLGGVEGAGTAAGVTGGDEVTGAGEPAAGGVGVVVTGAGVAGTDAGTLVVGDTGGLGAVAGAGVVGAGAATFVVAGAGAGAGADACGAATTGDALDGAVGAAAVLPVLPPEIAPDEALVP